ncbi:MAG: T9SS type A sorting domain-containing protein [Candidatus Cloacimonetes bacterium]|nr:T9SS type A sorting domain-containing protein [Candidatus Cloacimonadota bacterium]
MKKLIFIFILFIYSFVYAQFNPPQNLEVEQEYIYPCNYFYLSWDPPEPGEPNLINYNIYANWEIFDTVLVNILTYSMVDPVPPDSNGCIYFYITALYENPSGESPPSNIVMCNFWISVEDYFVDTSTRLLGNYPNPFNNTTSINFSLKRNSYVTLSIYNVKGKFVKTILDDQKHAGNYNIIWDGKDNFGTSISSGIYYYKMETDNYYEIKKCILLK